MMPAIVRLRSGAEEVMTKVIQEHIEVVQGPDGPKPRILGHRIRVQDIVIWHEKLGMSPDEIVHKYPTISHADVHAALAYYWDRRDEIERSIENEHALVEALRQNKGPLQERLTRQSLG